MSGCVVRSWQALIGRSDVAGWRTRLLERVVPTMQAVSGFRGLSVHVSQEGDPCQLTVLTRWADMDAVTSFAGEDPGRAVVPDYMERFFVSWDARATFHDEIIREDAV